MRPRLLRSCMISSLALLVYASSFLSLFSSSYVSAMSLSPFLLSVFLRMSCFSPFAHWAVFLLFLFRLRLRCGVRSLPCSRSCVLSPFFPFSRLLLLFFSFSCIFWFWYFCLFMGPRRDSRFSALLSRWLLLPHRSSRFAFSLIYS